jgi:preprotein translocase subunit SecG
MTALFFILIVISCAVLAFFVLIQNPKGGGLAGSLSGLGTQMMGAKQSTDIVEKGTWITAAAVLAFTLVSFIVSPKVTTKGVQKTRSEEAVKGVAPAAMPQQPQQAPATAPATAPAPATQPAQTPAAPVTPAP